MVLQKVRKQPKWCGSLLTVSDGWPGVSWLKIRWGVGGGLKRSRQPLRKTITWWSEEIEEKGFMDGHERIGEKYYNEVTLFTRKMKQLFFLRYAILDLPLWVEWMTEATSKESEQIRHGPCHTVACWTSFGLQGTVCGAHCDAKDVPFLQHSSITNIMSSRKKVWNCGKAGCSPCHMIL